MQKPSYVDAVKLLVKQFPYETRDLNKTVGHPAVEFVAELFAVDREIVAGDSWAHSTGRAAQEIVAGQAGYAGLLF